jgi:hypothetical protein
MEGKDKLNSLIQKRITEMFDEILKFSEVAVPNKYTYDKLRGRILTCGNNTIRILQEDCINFDIKYSPKISEVVELKDKGDRNG